MAKKEDREIAKIKGFLADVTEFKVKRRAKRLITTPGQVFFPQGF